MERPTVILLIHPEEQMHLACKRILGREGYEVKCCADSTQISELVDRHSPNAVLTAVRMPDKDGFQVLKAALAKMTRLPVIAITTHASIPEAVIWLKQGGADYLAVPFAADQLVRAVDEALRGLRASEGPPKSDRLKTSTALDAIIAASRPILKLKRVLPKVGRTDASVLIRGETGTGKELLAKAIHELSPRRSALFLPVDCAALPPTLLESELFGHEKGAFTGADRSRFGLFEVANHGTVFLDEIGELDVATQSKLFRVLQEGQIRQIGGRRSTPIDVRIIAATNRDLEGGIQQGLFRPELYFRLNVVSLTIPPLRQRKEDISLLCEHFFTLFRRTHERQDLAGCDSGFIEGLMEYTWPGNIRELMNAVEQAVVLSDGPNLTRTDLPAALLQNQPGPSGRDRDVDKETLDYATAREQLIDAFDQEFLNRLLSVCQGNLSEAARRSGLARKTLYNKLKRIGVLPFDVNEIDSTSEDVS
ncbi:sigma-54-dependent transcriptional regulator [Desulfomonile tiedjei]|uniref:Response regulator with CheY-like receiver, AAA-type ATPase, and DNA-binding domains n=1 Tax=Desulfomonile tiedjei (strain ATCC 49306 / DSM 6799 / DCB-1) TaxID=706587 RepID=I4C1D7_DESTA|nr:sigma-54 dependent transcriptional regulator [Desulfomonile tiedjei]AFM23378.1 response regulator with CheY-like receiver, AAA-type ATPase, and DNA-binding domains [Desulfomonile tiedjei DSM 6799]